MNLMKGSLDGAEVTGKILCLLGGICMLGTM